MRKIQFLLLLFSGVISNVLLADSSYYSIDKKDLNKVIVITNEPSNCGPRWNRAVREQLVLAEWKVLDELCYQIDVRKNQIVIKDPSKWMFSKSIIPASDFSRILSEDERKERGREQASIETWKAIQEFNRNSRIEQPRQSTCMSIGAGVMHCIELP